MRKLPAARAVLLLLAGLACAPALAATQGDPDWPCVQRKVPELSIGQMWPGPMPEGDWRADAGITRLSEVIAARRTTLDEVALLAADFAAPLSPSDRPGQMALLFSAVLDRIGAERRAVITGIGRYAHRQTDLAERIELEEAVLLRLTPEPDSDPDSVAELREKLTWDIRVFRERSQSLTYVCETPVLLEQRAFAIARLLAAES